MAARLCFVALMVVLAAACGHNKRATKTVTERAAFDFPCQNDDIKLVVLDAEGARDLASQIGARGCGKKAAYVFVPETNTWVLNGGVATDPTAHDPYAFHGHPKDRQEQKADKKAIKSVEKAVKQEEKQAKELQKPLDE